MGNLTVIKKYIEEIFEKSRFAALATEGDGQPHASLIAVTPYEGYRKLIFATYRNTRKYHNLAHNGKVAVLIQSNETNSSGLQESFVLTAIGRVEGLADDEKNSVLQAHLQRHPELKSFMQAEDCSLLCIKVDTYQVVRGIDDVEWWSVDDLHSPSN